MANTGARALHLTQRIPRLRRRKPSPTQKILVADFLEANPELARGRLNGPDSAIRASSLWRSVAERLNAAGDCIKTWKEWRKYWTDKKTTLKVLAARIREHTAETSGDPADYLTTLSKWDKRMLTLLGEDLGLEESYIAMLHLPGTGSAEEQETVATFLAPRPPPPEEFEEFDVEESSFTPATPSPPPHHTDQGHIGQPPAAVDPCPPPSHTFHQNGYGNVHLVVEQDRARAEDARQALVLQRQQVELQRQQVELQRQQVEVQRVQARQTHRLCDILERLLQKLD